MLRDALEAQRTGGFGRAGARRADPLAAEQVIGSQRMACARKLCGCSVEHDLATMLAGPRSYVENPVGCLYHFRIVLNNDECVSLIPQALHDADDAIHVARVQSDRGFVQDEQCVDQRGSQRRGQVDALHLSAA